METIFMLKRSERSEKKRIVERTVEKVANNKNKKKKSKRMW